MNSDWIIKVDDARYDITNAPQQLHVLVRQLQDIDWLIVEKQNRMATLRRAKHAYLTDLRSGIVKEKSGVDLSALLDGE